MCNEKLSPKHPKKNVKRITTSDLSTSTRKSSRPSKQSFAKEDITDKDSSADLSPTPQ
jgi:hypothetical protein